MKVKASTFAREEEGFPEKADTGCARLPADDSADPSSTGIRRLASYGLERDRGEFTISIMFFFLCMVVLVWV